MNKFAIILVYFGTFKPSISLLLESCNRNLDVDWYIFTDCVLPEEVTCKNNIYIVKTSLSKIKNVLSEKLNVSFELSRPYKLCDLKPFYGLIFEDYLIGYDYWGYGDTDVIYGRILEYLNKIEFHKYDKINWMGHLCFIKNTEDYKKVLLSNDSNTSSYIDVLTNKENIGFDERDFNYKYLNHGLKIYTGKWAADIDIYYWRMRCVDQKTHHILLNTKEIEYGPRNYTRQMFVLLNGIVYRVYLRFHKVVLEEFAYIHFRKEVPITFENKKRDSYIISRDGFYEFDCSKINDYRYIKYLINKYNNQENWIQEVFCFLHYFKRILKKNKS